MPSTTPQDRKKSKKRQPRPQAETAPPQPQQPGQNNFAPTSWANGGLGQLEDLVVPSGQRCLIRRPGVQGLMAAGVLHNVDSLSALVGEKHIKKTKQDDGSTKFEVNSETYLEDTEAIDRTIFTVDRVVSYCVVQPPVKMTPNDVTTRDPNVIYTDMVDLIDKMFIFTAVIGGVDDLATFREATSGHVGGVESV